MERDSIDRLLDDWAREWPALDVAPTAVVGRLHRVARHWEQRVEQVFGRFGLVEGGFGVLAVLRRSGPPYRLSPTALAARLQISSGAMTNRIDRLEAAGLVARAPDPDDRRGVLVLLTPAGRDLIDRAAPVHLANERRLLEPLNADERRTLADLLRKLLLSLEGGDGGEGGERGGADGQDGAAASRP